MRLRGTLCFVCSARRERKRQRLAVDQQRYVDVDNRRLGFQRSSNLARRKLTRQASLNRSIGDPLI